MKSSKSIKQKIKEWEGCKLTAYKCPSGIWTIGYGHTGGDVVAGRQISNSEADIIFEKDILIIEDRLHALEGFDDVRWSQGEYDAVLSLAFNIGIGNFERSTLWRKIQQPHRDRHSEATEFCRWVYGGGKKLPGLVKRRLEESKIYLT